MLGARWNVRVAIGVEVIMRRLRVKADLLDAAGEFECSTLRAPTSRRLERKRLQKRLRALEKLLDSRLVRIARLAGMDDRDLARFGSFHELTIGSR